MCVVLACASSIWHCPRQPNEAAGCVEVCSRHTSTAANMPICRVFCTANLALPSCEAHCGKSTTRCPVHFRAEMCMQTVSSGSQLFFLAAIPNEFQTQILRAVFCVLSGPSGVKREYPRSLLPFFCLFISGSRSLTCMGESGRVSWVFLLKCPVSNSWQGS